VPANKVKYVLKNPPGHLSYYCTTCDSFDVQRTQ